MISQDPEAPSSSETGWMRERTTTKATGCCWVLTGRVRSPVGSVHSAVYHSSPRAIMAVWTFAGRIWMAQEMPTCSVSVCQSSELQDGSAEPNHAYPPAPGLLHACFASDRQQSTQPSRHRRRRRPQSTGSSSQNLKIFYNHMHSKKSLLYQLPRILRFILPLPYTYPTVSRGPTSVGMLRMHAKKRTPLEFFHKYP